MTEPQEVQEPVAWYVTGCGRLLDEDEAKAEARRIGGTARAMPLYTAPQADSQPAGADRHGLPPLPDPDLRDVGTTPGGIKEFLRGYATEYAKAALAARAPADSVLEDAARLDFLIEQRAYVVSDPDACPGYWLYFFHKETGKCWAQIDEHPTPRAAIDAARKQGANHD